MKQQYYKIFKFLPMMFLAVIILMPSVAHAGLGDWITNAYNKIADIGQSVIDSVASKAIGAVAEALGLTPGKDCPVPC